MEYIADLHIHSKYSRATSKDMDIEHLAEWAKIKGISMLGTGDFTHPAWLAELERKLEKAGDGVYRHRGIDFILTTEVSNIYFKAGRTRKVHVIIAAPSFETAKEVNDLLSGHGDLSSDGRPIVSIECDRMVKLLSAIDPRILFIPGHAWTPHFGIFGSNSGFDSPEECFEDQLSKVFSIETGLSSDPAMNWRWSRLDVFTLTSHSDAHSPSKIGREANAFSGKINYAELADILRTKDASRFLYTIEFFPEEGKYHWDGHRLCNVSMPPEESIANKNTCPKCGKRMTIGVMHRLVDLADRKEGFVPKSCPSFRRAVPLAEIISDAIGVGPDSKAVEKEYTRLIKNLGTEMNILLYAPGEVLKEACPGPIANAILNVRNGNVEIAPGYDGEYGKVTVMKSAGEKYRKEPSLF